MKLNCWVMIDPDGRVLIDTRDFQSEADVWQIVLGWPHQDEIEYAKQNGWRVFRAEVQIIKRLPPSGTQ